MCTNPSELYRLTPHLYRILGTWATLPLLCLQLHSVGATLPVVQLVCALMTILLVSPLTPFLLPWVAARMSLEQRSSDTACIQMATCHVFGRGKCSSPRNIVSDSVVFSDAHRVAGHQAYP